VAISELCIVGSMLWFDVSRMTDKKKTLKIV